MNRQKGLWRSLPFSMDLPITNINSPLGSCQPSIRNYELLGRVGAKKCNKHFFDHQPFNKALAHVYAGAQN